MSTIPAGLRADYMRLRMLDKATIKHPGSLYVGGSGSVTYKDHTNINGREIIELEPSNTDLVLQATASNGIGYDQISGSVLVNGSIDAQKLGGGNIFPLDTTKQYSFDVITADAGKSMCLSMTNNLTTAIGTTSLDKITYCPGPDTATTRYFNPKVQFDNKIYYAVHYYNTLGGTPVARCVYYAQYNLNSYQDLPFTIRRTSSPLKNASLVQLNDKDRIYYKDVLTVYPADSSYDSLININDVMTSVPAHNTTPVTTTVGLSKVKVGQYNTYPIIIEHQKTGDQADESTLTVRRTNSWACNLPTNVYLNNGDIVGYYDTLSIQAQMAPYARGSLTYYGHGGTQQVQDLDYNEKSSYASGYVYNDQTRKVTLVSNALPYQSDVEISVTITQSGNSRTETIVITNHYAQAPVTIKRIIGSLANDGEYTVYLNTNASHTFTKTTTKTTTPGVVYALGRYASGGGLDLQFYAKENV